jgi:transcriptional regulator with XRE-family HTH domain
VSLVPDPDKLRAARVAAGFPRKEPVSVETGIPFLTLNSYELGTRKPSLRALSLLAETYGTALDDLCSPHGELVS